MHWIPTECYNNLNYARHSTPADVWAFGTTLWEIFMFGEVITQIDYLEAMKVSILISVGENATFIHDLGCERSLGNEAKKLFSFIFYLA